MSAIETSSTSCYVLPAHGSMTLLTPASSCKMIWVLRAILALNTEGKANASSKEFVCNDWVPPKTALKASTVVRTILLYGSFDSF